MAALPGEHKGVSMLTIVRRIGIAIGSLVIAYLAVSLAAGIVLGPSAYQSPLIAAIVIVLGGLVFADIIRRERPKPSADSTPTE